jgi:hypothetical protein
MQKTESRYQLTGSQREIHHLKPSFDLHAALGTIIPFSEFYFSPTHPGIIATRSIARQTGETVYTNRKGAKHDIMGIDELTVDDDSRCDLFYSISNRENAYEATQLET